MIDAQSGDIKIGNDVWINDYAILLGHGGIAVGNNVRIAARVVIAFFEHAYDDPTVQIRHQGIKKMPVIIEDEVWIGAGAKVLVGCHVGHGCVRRQQCRQRKTVPFGVYAGPLG